MKKKRSTDEMIQEAAKIEMDTLAWIDAEIKARHKATGCAHCAYETRREIRRRWAKEGVLTEKLKAAIDALDALSKLSRKCTESERRLFNEYYSSKT
jgi:hypothetical protein